MCQGMSIEKIMNLKPYPKYKDSGIEWLGEVPEGWEVIRLRNTINYKKGKNPTTLFEDNLNNQYLPYLSMDYLRNSGDESHFVEKSKNTVIANDGDILLLWDGSNAGEFIVSKNGAVSSTMAKIFPDKKLDKRFCFFLCKTIEPILREHTIGMGIPHVNANILKNIVCPSPLKNEQTAIATFLDHKTAKIDELIKKNETLVELLKEKRQAIISHAVTKGLDPNANMKNSGVEWIGEIPQGWEVKRLKFNLQLLTEKTDRRENPVALENIESWLGEYKETESEFQGEGVAFEKGDILFGKLRPYLAKVWLAYFSGEAIGDFFVMRPSLDIDGRFAVYQILNKEFISIVDGSTFGAKMPRVSWDFMANLRLPTPHIVEQHAIADYIGRETGKIDATIQKILSQIATLKEYRQTLISNVVTGKVRVL